LFVTYDTKLVAKQKVDYIKNGHLGGAMWWESSGDKPGADSLIDTVFTGLADGGIEYSENQLDYPQSKYDNLRNKFPDEQT
jgi:chitinase